MRFIIAPYDAASKSGGPAQCIRGWQSALMPIKEIITLEREFGPLLPDLLAREINRCLDERRVPITLGGDHSLTYIVLREITSRMGPLTVVHFDAHHDAYPAAVLNHYSIFAIAQHLLPIKVIGVGHRYDCSPPLPPFLNEEVNGPIYISLDVDYFSPALVSCVGDPVITVEGFDCTLESFVKSLELLKGPIIGADILEWIGDKASQSETSFISTVVANLVKKING